MFKRPSIGELLPGLRGFSLLSEKSGCGPHYSAFGAEQIFASVRQLSGYGIEEKQPDRNEELGEGQVSIVRLSELSNQSAPKNIRQRQNLSGTCRRGNSKEC